MKDNDLNNQIIEELTKAFKKAQEEDAKYDFFNKDEFQMKFKNLLAFMCILGSVGEDFAKFELGGEINHEYIIEKYCRYLKNNSVISEEEKEKALKFSHSIDKICKPDTLISKYEAVFGKGSFFSIPISSNYRTGLHALLKSQIFDVYMKNMFNDSKKYKIWKILNSK